MIKQYRKKPVVISAVLCSQVNDPFKVAEWCGGTFVESGVTGAPGHIIIKTLEGDMRAEIGDYIIKGVEGEFYPCKPDIFNKTYEEA